MEDAENLEDFNEKQTSYISDSDKLIWKRKKNKQKKKTLKKKKI